MTYKKFVRLSLIPLLTLASCVTAVASDEVDLDEITSQKIMGYDVLCKSYGDLYWQQMKSTHKAYNFCTPGAVGFLLGKAAQLKQPNFAGDLKIFSFYPNVQGKPQQDYSLVVVIDEKAKQILPDAAIYMNQKYIDKGMGQGDTKKAGYASPTGKVTASINSAMYCFKNPNLGYASIGGFYEPRNETLCSLYKGYYPGTGLLDAYGNFMVIPRIGELATATRHYSIFTGVIPEKTGEYDMYHRTAKYLIQKAKR